MTALVVKELLLRGEEGTSSTRRSDEQIQFENRSPLDSISRHHYFISDNTGGYSLCTATVLPRRAEKMTAASTYRHAIHHIADS